MKAKLSRESKKGEGKTEEPTKLEVVNQKRNHATRLRQKRRHWTKKGSRPLDWLID